MRVLLATDRPSLAAALTLYLEARDLDVVGVVANAEEIEPRALESHAEVVLVDWHLGEVASIEAFSDLRRALGRTPVIVLGSSGDSEAAQGSGAAGFATFGDAPEALLALMHEVVSGRS